MLTNSKKKNQICVAQLPGFTEISLAGPPVHHTGSLATDVLWDGPTTRSSATIQHDFSDNIYLVLN
jgi:hypothetical protein